MKTRTPSSKPAKAPKADAKGKASKPPILDMRNVSRAELDKALKGAAPKTKLAASPAVKPQAGKKATSGKHEGKMSGLAAAAKVLAETGKPMRCSEMVKVMLDKGYWSTQGKTPAATLYSAILREIDGKPGESRFIKTDRGLFGLATAKK